MSRKDWGDLFLHALGGVLFWAALRDWPMIAISASFWFGMGRECLQRWSLRIDKWSAHTWREGLAWPLGTSVALLLQRSLA